MPLQSPRDIADELEANASLPDVPDRERLRGYAVTGLPFRSGHVLAMRRFPATSIGPGYTSVWHRDPHGRWVIYQDQEPLLGCPRAFGPAIDDARVVPISIDWTGADRFSMDIDTDRVRLHWHVQLVATRLTRALNVAAGCLPAPVRRSPRLLAVLGRAAGPMLRVGRVRLAGTVPSGQDFAADLRRMWLVGQSTAVIDDTGLGELGPVAEQPHLADFWIPQRGIFAVADAFFEPYDADRHLQVPAR